MVCSMSLNGKEKTTELTARWTEEQRTEVVEEHESAATSNDPGNTAVKTEPAKKESLTPENTDTQKNETKNFETYSGKLGECEHEDRFVPEWDVYAAYITAAYIGDSEENEAHIKTEFARIFGYEAVEEVSKTLIGTFLIEGNETPQQIYTYEILDKTYPLLVDDFYVITKKICSDGSAWIGFSVPGNIYSMDQSSKVAELLSEMNEEFCEWTGYDMEYIRNNKDKFAVNRVSSAGWRRTKDGQLVELVYRYTRGFGLPIE